MKNIRVWNSVVLSGYSLLLLVLGYLFFTNELRYTTALNVKIPVDFIIRFFAFWFVSFLLAIMVYLLNLGYNYLWLPRLDKKNAVEAGKLIFSVGMGGAIIMLLVFYLFT